jgi:chromosome segregation ATPase
MNDQQPQPPQFSIAELGAKLGAKFGAQLGQANAEIIALEKVVEAQRLQIQSMTARDGDLTENIEDLEADISVLKNENLDLGQEIEQQRVKIAMLTSNEAELVAKIHDLEERLKSFGDLGDDLAMDETQAMTGNIIPAIEEITTQTKEPPIMAAPVTTFNPFGCHVGGVFAL